MFLFFFPHLDVTHVQQGKIRKEKHCLTKRGGAQVTLRCNATYIESQTSIVYKPFQLQAIVRRWQKYVILGQDDVWKVLEELQFNKISPSSVVSILRQIDVGIDIELWSLNIIA